MQMPSRTPDEILEELQPIFRGALDEPELTVTLRSNAKNTPNWDSLTHIEILGMVEHRFHVKFGLGELQDLMDVGDLVTLLIEKTK
jgi:acyl carrier protein